MVTTARAVTAQVPMRDGVRLHTEVRLPDAPHPVPAVLIRTPYPDGVIAWADRPVGPLLAGGYAVATQSCRGTGHSEGEASFLRADAEDGYDAVEWLAAQPWCDGRVAMYGASYSASVQHLAAALRPPHLVALAMLSPGAMFFEEAPFLGGALVKQHLLVWPRLTAVASRAELDAELGPDPGRTGPVAAAMAASPNEAVIGAVHADSPMGRSLLEGLRHPTLDAWWEAVMPTPASAARTDLPVLIVTGFHDGDQVGALHCWQLLERHAPAARDRRHLVIGPWRHADVATGTTRPTGLLELGPDGDLDVPGLVRDFLDAHLRGDAAARDRLPDRCRVHTSGPGGDAGRWHELPAYPPATAVALHLLPAPDGGRDGLLRWSPPTGEQPATRFRTDWRDPVPVVPVGEDGADVDAREDVVTFTSAPLEAPLTLLGPVRARIWVAADVPDVDLVGRLAEVRPDGTAVDVTGEWGFGAVRARYREGYHREVLLEPGVPTPLPLHLAHVGRTFAAGSRIRLSLCGTAAGVLEPNHHTGEPVLTAVRRRTAEQIVLHDAAHPSHLELPVLTGGVAVAADADPPPAEPSLAEVRAVLRAIGRMAGPDGVDREARVLLGGVRQWVGLRGQDRSAPVLLFLHGGPGDPVSPIAHAYQRPWEDCFVVANWDQRGFGRSWGTPEEAPLIDRTLDRPQLIADAIELIEWLRAELDQPKVLLVGQSWGSVLALEVARRRPDLLHAVCAQGLAANWLASAEAVRREQIRRAADRGDAAEAARLAAVGPPPLDRGLDAVMAWPAQLGVGVPADRSWHNVLGDADGWAARIAVLRAISPDPGPDDVRERDADRLRARYDAMMRSVLTWDAVTDVGVELEVPLVVMMGRHDLQTPTSLARAYYERVRAPWKRWVELPHAAHALNVEQPGLAVLALGGLLLPAARGEEPPAWVLP